MVPFPVPFPELPSAHLPLRPRPHQVAKTPDNRNSILVQPIFVSMVMPAIVQRQDQSLCLCRHRHDDVCYYNCDEPEQSVTDVTRREVREMSGWGHRSHRLGSGRCPHPGSFVPYRYHQSENASGRQPQKQTCGPRSLRHHCGHRAWRWLRRRFGSLPHHRFWPLFSSSSIPPIVSLPSISSNTRTITKEQSFETSQKHEVRRHCSPCLRTVPSMFSISCSRRSSAIFSDSLTAPLLLLLLVLSWSAHYAHCCYVYPPDVKDPCKDKDCSFGAQCAPSLDGLTARCQCPDHCDSFGDSVGSTPVCGSDGKDYSSQCEMRRTACTEMKDLRVKYFGKCGKYKYTLLAISYICFPKSRLV